MVFILFIISSPASAARQTESDLVLDWFELALDLSRETPGQSPPVVSRAFGYLGVTAYEAVAPGFPTRASLVGQLNEFERLPALEPGRHDWPTVASRALARVSSALFPAAPDHLKNRLTTLADDQLRIARATLDAVVVERSLRRGDALASAVLAWASKDGADRTARFDPKSLPGSWMPTPPAKAAALLPNWGTNRPFALRKADGCTIAPPVAYSTAPESEFAVQAMEVLNLSRSLTPEQRAIAEFWSDDPGRTATPPGHWVSILTQILRAREVTLDVATEGYARLGIALADAFIGCWHAKYRYDLLRPVTYLQMNVAPEWMPLLTTPPFPEYPSGHSVQSAAAARVLEAMFGPSVAFVDRTHSARGLPARSYTSFQDAAREAAISRLYGGIHFRAAIENGMVQGECIGEQVNALQWQARSANTSNSK